MSMAVKLDFKEHVAPKIRFLADLGVHHDKVKPNWINYEEYEIVQKKVGSGAYRFNLFQVTPG